jgi:hypothetical protein
MSMLDTIFESEDFQNHLYENSNILLEAEELVQDFSKVIKSFIIANPSEFLAENVDQMRKNIRVFTEVATAQYIQEISAMVGNALTEHYSQETIHEGSSHSTNDYL